MPIGSQFYYRDTSLGWPGNPNPQSSEITCVSTDPLVATLFAIECRSRGAAAVLIASRSRFRVLEADPTNLIDVRLTASFAAENAVNLQVSAADFERSAEIVVDVDEAIDLLGRMGFGTLPARLGRREALDDEIRSSYNEGNRLTVRQLAEFEQLVQGARP